MLHQSMSARVVKARIEREAQAYGRLIRDEEWTLELAHQCLLQAQANKLDLFMIAGLAMAIACFQCSE